jgi:ABC-type antimicrobial peptide transport system permease subunit
MSIVNHLARFIGFFLAWFLCNLVTEKTMSWEILRSSVLVSLLYTVIYAVIEACIKWVR